MNKYAFIVPCTPNYTYGLNAILNAAVMYGNIADYYILGYGKSEHPICKKFLEETQALPFPVKFIELSDIIGGTKFSNDATWQLFYARHLLASRLQQYDSVCILDADDLVVANIMDWFQVCANTEFIVIGHNVWGPYNFKQRGLSNANEADTPYYSHPCWYNPRRDVKICERIYEIGYDYQPIFDMPANWFAFTEAGRKVILLPDNQWMWNTVSANFRNNPISKLVIDGQIHLVSNLLKERIYNLHNKFFFKNHIEKIIAMYKCPIVESNMQICMDVCEYLNTQCTIKLPYGVSL